MKKKDKQVNTIIEDIKKKNAVFLVKEEDLNKIMQSLKNEKRQNLKRKIKGELAENLKKEWEKQEIWNSSAIAKKYNVALTTLNDKVKLWENEKLKSENEKLKLEVKKLKDKAEYKTKEIFEIFNKTKCLMENNS